MNKIEGLRKINFDIQVNYPFLAWCFDEIVSVIYCNQINSTCVILKNINQTNQILQIVKCNDIYMEPLAIIEYTAVYDGSIVYGKASGNEYQVLSKGKFRNSLRFYGHTGEIEITQLTVKSKAVISSFWYCFDGEFKPANENAYVEVELEEGCHIIEKVKNIEWLNQPLNLKGNRRRYRVLKNYGEV